MTIKIVMFNGPPRCGKDTAALATADEYGSTFDRMSMPIKAAFAGMVMEFMDEYGNVETYEEVKDQVIPFLGVSYRQWQIDFSEKFMKPLYGNDIFGKLIVNRIKQFADAGRDSIVIPDCGFQIEVDTITAAFDHRDIMLVRVLRDGTDFSIDSRSYVEPVGTHEFVVLENNGTKEEFQQKVLGTVEDFIG